MALLDPQNIECLVKFWFILRNIGVSLLLSKNYSAVTENHLEDL